MGTSAVCKGLGGMGGIRRGPHECLISCPSESANMATTVAISYYHRRRIDLEYKAKVVASDWGTEVLPR